MACPVCSPLAIPLLGAGGLLAFLTPARAWLALASLVLLGATLLLLLRDATTCDVSPRALPAESPLHDDALTPQVGNPRRSGRTGPTPRRSEPATRRRRR